MEQPLGRNIGNRLEVVEAIEFLQGHMEKDVKEVVLELGSNMLNLAGYGESLERNKMKMQEVIENRKAIEKLKQLVQKQGGNINYIEHIEEFKKASYILPIIAEKSGVVQSLKAEEVGKISVNLGAGRLKKDDKIDNCVGIVLEKKMRDTVNAGEILAYIHANNEEKGKEAVQKLKEVYEIK